MKKKEINKKEIIKGLVGVLLILIIPIVGYSVGTKKTDIWMITAVIQACFTLLWILSFTGEYARFAKGFKLMWGGMRKSKTNKLGSVEHTEKRRAGKTIKTTKKAIRWEGVIIMAVALVVEIILAVVTAY